MISFMCDSTTKQILVIVQEKDGGYSYWLPDHWNIALIERHFMEMEDYLDEA